MNPLRRYNAWITDILGNRMLESESDEEQRFEQELLNWVCLACMVCGMVWSVFIWRHLGPCITAFIPLSFTVIVAPFYIHSNVVKELELLAKVQSLAIIFVPWGIQLSLGNYASGMAIIWGILGPMCGLFFLTRRQAAQLFIIFTVNSIIATCLNPQLTEDHKLASEDFVSTFYAMNIGLPSLVVFGALWYTFARLSYQRGKVSTLLQETETKNRSLLDSITYAEYLQRAVLPAFGIFKNKYPNSFLFLKPKDIVSGDFFWTADLEGRSYFAVCDCTGHGVPGSLVSIICNNALNEACRNLNSAQPDSLLEKTKEIVSAAFNQSSQNINDGMDIGLCRIDGHNLMFAGARHSLYLYRRNTHSLQEIKGTRQSVCNSFTTEKSPFVNHEFKLCPGDRIYLTTDGLLDQFGGDANRKFLSIRFRELLLNSAHLSLSKQALNIENFVEQWMGDQEQIDDMCVFGMQID